jgi:hypothetical protein
MSNDQNTPVTVDFDVEASKQSGTHDPAEMFYDIRVEAVEMDSAGPTGKRTQLVVPISNQMLNHYTVARGTKNIEAIVYNKSTAEQRQKFKDANGLTTASPHLWHKDTADHDPDLLLRFIVEHDIELPYYYPDTSVTQMSGVEAAANSGRYSVSGMAQIKYAITNGKALYTGTPAGNVTSKIGGAGAGGKSTQILGKTADGKLPAFPIDVSVKVGRHIMRAQEAGELHGDFSNRQIIQWALLYYQFVDWGVNVPDAIRLSFHMVCLWRAEKDERDVYISLFQQEFGYEVNIKSLTKILGPTLKKMQADLGGKILHPHFPLVMAALYTKLPLWVHGPSGSGKSFAIRQAAELLDLELVRMQGSSESEGYHVFGRDILESDDGVTVTRRIDGPALYAMQNPTLLNMDEISLFTGSVRSKFHAVLELERTNFVGDDDGGVEYEIHDDMRFVFADNTLGLGEHPKYVGIEPVNEAFRNRCVFVWFPPMTESFQKKAVAQELNGQLEEIGWEVV